MREVMQLARQGVREITFLGQNVNAYRGDIDGDHADLAELLHYAADVPGIERLRFTTSHPVEFSNSLDRGVRDAAAAGEPSASAGAVGFRSRCSR